MLARSPAARSWLTPVGALAFLVAVLGIPPAADAQRGSEFDLVGTPVEGGMAGTGVARAPSPMAMIFGNPATMTQLQSQMQFTLGGALFKPELDGATREDLSEFGIPSFDGRSKLRDAATPHAAAVSRLPFGGAVMGVGVTGISGLGSDFRLVIPGLEPLADLKIFGANASLAFPVTDRLSVGAGAVLGIGSLQAGLLQNTASVNDFGVGGRFGAAYDLGPVVAGAAFNTELEITYEHVVENRPGNLASVRLQQPRALAAGVSTTDALMENLMLQAEVDWKDWSDALTYQDFWDDQVTVTVGGELTAGRFTFRSGYSYTGDIRKEEDELGTSFGRLETLAVRTPSGERVAAPITPTLIQLIQVTMTDGYWSHNLHGGFGFQIMDPVRVDAFFGAGIDGDEEIGPFHADGEILRFGAGLTWNVPMPGATGGG